MQWFVDLLSKWKIPAAISAPLFTLLAAVIVYFTTKTAVVIPPALPPTYTVVMPGLEPEPLVVGATQESDVPVGVTNESLKDRHVVVTVARRFAGQRYAREHNLSREQGRTLAFTVPAAEIEQRVKDEKMLPAGETIDGIPVAGGKLSDWLAAHPDFFNNLIKLIMMLLPLFADAHQMDMLNIPLDDTRTCQVPYPLAWKMEDNYSLSA